MLYVFGFEEIAVVVGDVFFKDERPLPGQDSAEAGVRLELRSLAQLPLRGSEYSATPIAVETPHWRVDLFESVPGGTGKRDRVHYHPRFDGWEPGRRHFDEALSADPLAWVSERLADLPALLGVDEAPDSAAVARAAGEIGTTIGHLWGRVRAGELDPEEGWTEAPACRRGWL